MKIKPLEKYNWPLKRDASLKLMRIKKKGVNGTELWMGGGLGLDFH